MPAQPVDLKKAGEESPAVKQVEEELAKPLAKPEGKVDGTKKPELHIGFKVTETAIPLTVKPDLDKIAERLKANTNERVVLMAYASSIGDQSSTARRVSLSRALSVRAHLIDAGINSLRINVQAEGSKNPGGDPDRVDIFVESTKEEDEE